MDLSIEIPRKAVRILGSISLQECLKTFFTLEKMIDSGYKCESCKKAVNIEKDISIYQFPRILTIHLKRFYHSSMRREKISSAVQIPENLSMGSFAPNSKHESVKQANYKLYGVSHHSGSLYGGHYICEVQNVTTGRWYRCNDSHVN